MNPDVLLFAKQVLGIEPFNDERKSTLIMALRTARHNTGRDIDSGVYKEKFEYESLISNGLYESSLFIGTAIYLIVLDQIGGLFLNNAKAPDLEKNDNDIIVALKSFTNLKPEERNAINALRNSLAHKFSLATEIKNEMYKFSLNYEKGSQIVDPKPFSKTSYQRDKSMFEHTEIGVVELCNEIENIYATIVKDIEKGTIQLRMAIYEIKARYTIL